MRKRIRTFLARPQVDIAIFLFILFSVLSLVLELVSQDAGTRMMFEAAGHWIIFVFWIELAMRYFAARSRPAFFREYWLDLLSVLPVPAIPTMHALRLLRLVRILRLFRAGVIWGRRFARLSNAFFAGSGELFFIGSLVSMVVVFGSTGMYFVQKHLENHFTNFEDAVWFSLFSMIAGEPIQPPEYGTPGRIIALVVVLSGMTVWAMFIGVVTAVISERLRRHLEASPMDLQSLEGHLVVCGWNSSGMVLLQQIQRSEAAETPIVVVCEKELTLREEAHRSDLVYVLRGDPTRQEVLRSAGVERARLAILLADQSSPRTDQDRDARSILTALMVEKLNPRILTCVELLNADNEAHIRQAGVESVVVPSDWGAHLMSSLVVHQTLTAAMEELLDRHRGNSLYVVDCPQELVGARFTDAVTRLKRGCDVLLVGVEENPRQDDTRTKPPRPRAVLNPPADRVLSDSEKLIVMAAHRPNGGTLTLHCSTSSFPPA